MLIKIYPNPDDGSFTIESSSTIQKIEILKVDGSLIFLENTSSHKVSVASVLPKGIYIARIFLKEKNENLITVNRKLIVK